MTHVAPMGCQMYGDLWQELSHLSQKVSFLEGALQLNMQAMNARIDASKSASDRADMWILKEVSAFRLASNNHVAQLQSSLEAVMAEQESARIQQVANQSVVESRFEEFECKIEAQHAECAKMHAELLKVQMNASQLESIMGLLDLSDSEPTSPHSNAEVENLELSPDSTSPATSQAMEPIEQELEELHSSLHDAEASSEASEASAQQTILEKLEDTKIHFETELQALNRHCSDAIETGQAQMKFDQLRGLLRLFPFSGVGLENMKQDSLMTQREALKRDSWMQDVSNTLQRMREKQDSNFDWINARCLDIGNRLKEFEAEMERITFAIDFLQGSKVSLDKESRDSDGSDASESPRDRHAEFNEFREGILNELNAKDGLQQIRQDIIHQMTDKKEPSTPSSLEAYDL
eukprot:Skav217948  [mRNA]  locus=scaffold2349:38956:40176:- [translate_table: standard]